MLMNSKKEYFLFCHWKRNWPIEKQFSTYAHTVYRIGRCVCTCQSLMLSAAWQRQMCHSSSLTCYHDILNFHLHETQNKGNEFWKLDIISNSLWNYRFQRQWQLFTLSAFFWCLSTCIKLVICRFTSFCWQEKHCIFFMKMSGEFLAYSCCS